MAILPEGWNLPIVGFSLVEGLRSTAVLLRLVKLQREILDGSFHVLMAPAGSRKAGSTGQKLSYAGLLYLLRSQTLEPSQRSDGQTRATDGLHDRLPGHQSLSSLQPLSPSSLLPPLYSPSHSLFRVTHPAGPCTVQGPVTPAGPVCPLQGPAPHWALITPGPRATGRGPAPGLAPGSTTSHTSSSLHCTPSKTASTPPRK